MNGPALRVMLMLDAIKIPQSEPLLPVPMLVLASTKASTTCLEVTVV